MVIQSRTFMNQNVKRAVLSALTLATVSLPLATASPASAINTVPCGPRDYVKVTFHIGIWAKRHVLCFANAGEIPIVVGQREKVWVHQISTGNNRVQWYGDGRWQPNRPINKWTIFRWPNHPGGVRLDRIRIL
jgi:hypothetical protein